MDQETNFIITNGIRVSVETSFLPAQSSFSGSHYSFAYRIRISNHSEYTMQLLRRKWIVKNALGESHVVEGEGVVGEQPVLAPGEEHSYVSGTHFNTRIGQMEGYYTMERKADGKLIQVRIPVFVMMVPSNLN